MITQGPCSHYILLKLWVLIVHICTQHNSGGITQIYHYYKLLIIIFVKCFLACPNMKAQATYAHLLTFNDANL